MAGTAQVTSVATAYTSLGTGPMFITVSGGPIQIAAAAGQPAASAVGHPIPAAGPLQAALPLYFSLAEQVWSIGAATVTVTT